MAVRKVSVSLPEEIVESAMESAVRRELGLSAWLTEAAREKLRAELEFDEGYRAAQELVVEYETKHGPIPDEDWAFADAVVASAYSAQARAGEDRHAG